MDSFVKAEERKGVREEQVKEKEENENNNDDDDNNNNNNNNNNIGIQEKLDTTCN